MIIDTTIYNDTIRRYISTAQAEIDYIYRDVADGIDRATYGGRWYGKKIDTIYSDNRGQQGAGMALATICTDCDCGWDQVIAATLARNITVGRKSRDGYYTAYRIFRADLIDYYINRGATMLVNHRKIYDYINTDRISTTDDAVEEMTVQDIQSYNHWAEAENNQSDPDFLQDLIVIAQQAAHTRIAKDRIAKFLTDIINGQDYTADYKANRHYLQKMGYFTEIQRLLASDPRVASIIAKRKKLNAMADVDAEMKKMKKNK